MPLYCFVCSDCGYKWEDFRPVSSIPDECPECNKDLVLRDYASEGFMFFEDIKPYFDISLGQKVTGRRDKANKYRAAGMTMVGASQGGDSVMPSKTLYSDEKYHDDWLVGKKSDDERAFDEKLMEKVQMGVEGDYADSGDDTDVIG